MLAADRDAVICDLAETYGVLDYRALPVETLAVLCIGLRDDSRIKMKMTGAKMKTDTMLVAAAVDRLTFIAWTKTKDAEKGRNRPRSILESIAGNTRSGSIMAFDTAEEFENAKAEIIGRR